MGFRSTGKRLLIPLLIAAAVLAGCSSSMGAGTTTKPSADPGTVQVNAVAASSAVAQLNNYRLQAALPPVVLDPRLSLGAQLHANYLDLNSVSLSQVGLNAHIQLSHQPGFSEQGYRAGINSVIYEGVQPVQAIDNWMQTFYHRLGLMDPNLTAVGFGSQGRYQVMDVGQGRVMGFNALDGVALFPAVGMTVGGAYIREIPHPIPGNDNIGVPITVEFFGMRGLSITDVSAAVYDVETNREFGVYVQYPGKPFLPTWDLQQVICIIPHAPLPAGKTYRVALYATVDGAPFPLDNWTFHTR